MKTDPNEPYCPIPYNVKYAYLGLTKLEAFTMAAKQGLCANKNMLHMIGDARYSAINNVAKYTIEISKATSAALNNEKEVTK